MRQKSIQIARPVFMIVSHKLANLASPARPTAARPGGPRRRRGTCRQSLAGTQASRDLALLSSSTQCSLLGLLSDLSPAQGLLSGSGPGPSPRSPAGQGRPGRQTQRSRRTPSCSHGLKRPEQGLGWATSRLDPSHPTGAAARGGPRSAASARAAAAVRLQAQRSRLE